MSNIAIGTPQYGSKKKNNFRIQDGENIYRILPPLGELAAEGTWATYKSLHWGYKGDKLGMRPFECIQKKNFKTKMVTQPCPECDLIDTKKAQLAAMETRLRNEGKSDDEIKEFVKPMQDWLMSHNLDKKWYVNAMSKDGKIGRLAIPHKMFTQLQEIITELATKRGLDPIGVDGGLWFILTRSGRGAQTTHRVGVEEQVETVNGRAMRTEKPAPLAEDVLNRLGVEAFDLRNSFRAITFDEIAALVNSGGDPQLVDAIFGGGETSHEEPEATAVRVNVAAPRQTPPVVVAPAATPSVTVVNTVPDFAAQKAALEAQMKALQEQQAKLAAASAPASVGMTDDDFVKQYGGTK